MFFFYIRVLYTYAYYYWIINNSRMWTDTKNSHLNDFCRIAHKFLIK